MGIPFADRLVTAETPQLPAETKLLTDDVVLVIV